jgi:hypothetical protein
LGDGEAELGRMSFSPTPLIDRPLVDIVARLAIIARSAIVRKIQTELAFRLPQSRKPLGHIVLTRDEALQLIADILGEEEKDTMSTNQTHEPLLQFFEFEHLKPELAEVSKPFRFLADEIVATLPRNPERTVALRKLLEAKDCAVRAKVFKAEIKTQE